MKWLTAKPKCAQHHDGLMVNRAFALDIHIGIALGISDLIIGPEEGTYDR